LTHGSNTGFAGVPPCLASLRGPSTRVPSKPPGSCCRGIVDCAANVDAPLAEAVDLLHALLVMGYGMIDNNEDGGRPVVAVTGAVWERLNAVRDAWREVVETAQRQMR
jgi:hypothetical protein